METPGGDSEDVQERSIESNLEEVEVGPCAEGNKIGKSMDSHSRDPQPIGNHCQLTT